jgi:hypothetical protein
MLRIISNERETGCGLTHRASAAATCPLAHYLTFLRPEASASCMRLLGGAAQRSLGVKDTTCVVSEVAKTLASQSLPSAKWIVQTSQPGANRSRHLVPAR